MKKIEGIVATTSRGVGYIEHEDFTKDVEIDAENLGTALNRDSVLVELLKIEKGRQKGRVVKVLERSKEKFVGTIEEKKGRFFLITDDFRIHRDFLIKDSKKPKEGFKAVGQLIEWTDPQKDPEVKILKTLGKKGEHEAEMQSIIAANGIVYSFPQNVEDEANKIKSNEKQIFDDAINDKERRDLRDVLTFTIDPADAKDFDDAISFRDLGNSTFEIGIHIADVSHYVIPGSALDEEARDRGFSTYLVDRTIPMLPEALSNDLCSLMPNVDRLAFSAIFKMKKDGTVIDGWFGKTIIHSDRRFDYLEAQSNIDTNSGDNVHELQILNEIAKKLRDERFLSGAINFRDDEVKFELDDKGRPVRVYKKDRVDTHKLVEEFMLLANQQVAMKIYELCDVLGRDHLFVYRIHETPNREKLEELSIFLRALGYNFKVTEDISPKELNDLLLSSKGKAEEGLINHALIRSMSKAVYSTKNKGHFGLAFEYYTHFTSPIRRYPDLIVHRLLQSHLHGLQISKQELSSYEKATHETSDKEVNIMRAERESIKYKQVEYLLNKVGQEFDAIISGVSENGIFVEDTETKANGLVRIRDLGDDYFKLNPKKFAIIGERTKQKFTVGDAVRVKLKAANLDRRQLDFAIVK